MPLAYKYVALACIRLFVSSGHDDDPHQWNAHISTLRNACDSGLILATIFIDLYCNDDVVRPTDVIQPGSISI